MIAIFTTLRISNIITTPILQIIKLSLREKALASKEENQDLNPGSVAP